MSEKSKCCGAEIRVIDARIINCLRCGCECSVANVPDSFPSQGELSTEEVEAWAKEEDRGAAHFDTVVTEFRAKGWLSDVPEYEADADKCRRRAAYLRARSAPAPVASERLALAAELEEMAVDLEGYWKSEQERSAATARAAAAALREADREIQ
jgi:hypothetical protein